MVLSLNRYISKLFVFLSLYFCKTMSNITYLFILEVKNALQRLSLILCYILKYPIKFPVLESIMLLSKLQEKLIHFKGKLSLRLLTKPIRKGPGYI